MFMEFLNKIKSFFSRIFSNSKLMLDKPKEKTNMSDNQFVNVSSYGKSKNTIEMLKKENLKNKTINDIIKMVESNPKLMRDLSFEQLDVIDKYYINATKNLAGEIELLDRKIEKVNAYLKEMQAKIS